MDSIRSKILLAYVERTERSDHLRSAVAAPQVSADRGMASPDDARRRLLDELDLREEAARPGRADLEGWCAQIDAETPRAQAQVPADGRMAFPLATETPR